MSAIAGFILSSLSGLLLYASFPTLELSFFVWIALVPFFIVLLRNKPLIGFLWSFIFCVVFYTGIFIWIFDLAKYNLLHHAILWLYLGPLIGLFGLAFSYIARRFNVTAALFSAPFLWVTLEYIRSNLFFLSLPWGLLAHTQYQNTLVIQIASVTGVYGISFLIVLVNSAITALVIAMVNRLKSFKPLFYQPLLSNKELSAILAAAGICVALATSYGYITIFKPIVGKKVKLTVVQGNIGQSKKWDRKYAKFIMLTYADLTKQAKADLPDLIVWPETATPRAINRDPGLYNQVQRIAREAGTYILLGSSQLQKFKKEASRKVKYFNSAFLIPPDIGKVKTQRYDKIRLLTFGEYLPYKETIPWSYIKVPDVGSYMPGDKYTVFNHPEFKFGVTICWENIFPGLVREFVKNGAQFIVNITNEAWFGKTAAPYQFLSMNVFRAVENRVYVVRSANTGISCFIDPYGRVIDKVKDENGQDIFVRGVLTGSVVPQDSQTLYTQYGDWIVWFCIFGAITFVILAFSRKGKQIISSVGSNGSS